QALDRGDVKEAEGWCKKVLQTNPNVPQAHFLIGLIAVSMDEKRIAANVFLKVTKLDSKHAGAWAHLAKIFSELGFTVRADEAIAKAAALKPNHALVQNVIGSVYTQIGEHEKASTWYSQAYQSEPNNPAYATNLANAYNFTGKRREAKETIEALLKISPNNPQAHWIGAGLHRQTSDETANTMLKIANEFSGNDSAQAFLYYGAGKVFEDVENWDAAFEVFHKGAKAKRQTLDFDEIAEERLFETLHDTFDDQWLANVSAASDVQGGPIFIVGQPRTGTTLIERIITAHSKVTSAGELQQFYLSMRRLSQVQTPSRVNDELIKGAAKIDPSVLGKAYLHGTRSFGEKGVYFVDKMPVNYLYVPLIARALPNAKIIHVTRDPADSCFSSFKQLFAQAYPHSYNLEEMARHHVRYRKLMQQWRDVVGGRMLEVSYEETVVDLESNARRLIEFLGLEWEQACLDFHKQSGAVSTASASQVREPAHTRSVGRWKRYEDQLKPVIEILKNAGL
ncbi:MAG: sulfotransferase, partial [Litorimonas sp.]